jgi:hypothetical protein
VRRKNFKVNGIIFVAPISLIFLTTEQLPRILDHFNEEAAADSESLVTVFSFH